MLPKTEGTSQSYNSGFRLPQLTCTAIISCIVDVAMLLKYYGSVFAAAVVIVIVIFSSCCRI